jgi:hypothetical protein
MVEDLPGYLRPGGQFFALTMGSDREKPFEHRLRQWLGAAAPDFDIAFLVRKTISASAYAADVVVLQKGSADDIAGWRELFEQWDVRALVYGVVVIQRRTGDRPVFTVRRDVGPKTGPAECAWLVEWATAALDASKVLPMKPRARDNASLKVEHRFAGGEWQPESYRLVSEYPFRATMKCESWPPHLLTIANGSHTIQELLDQLKSSEALPQTVASIEFAPVVAAMICSGFLEVDEFKLPAANTADAHPPGGARPSAQSRIRVVGHAPRRAASPLVAPRDFWRLNRTLNACAVSLTFILKTAGSSSPGTSVAPFALRNSHRRTRIPRAKPSS